MTHDSWGQPPKQLTAADSGQFGVHKDLGGALHTHVDGMEHATPLQGRSSMLTSSLQQGQLMQHAQNGLMHDIRATELQQPSPGQQAQQLQSMTEYVAAAAHAGQQLAAAQAQQLQPKQSQQAQQPGWGLPPLPPNVVQQQQQQLIQQRQQQSAHPAADAATPGAAAAGTVTAAGIGSLQQQQQQKRTDNSQQAAAAATAGVPTPTTQGTTARMCHVLGDNGKLDLGGGISFKIPMWYDDLAKTGLVPRWATLATVQVSSWIH